MIRLIAIDIDGMLVKYGSHEIDPAYYDVIRELKEETGIDVTADQIVYLGEATREAHGIGKNYGVTMDVNLEDLFFSDGEVMDARWLSREEFERMRDNEEFAPSVFRFMEGYKEGFLRFMGWEDRDGRGSSRKTI